MVLLIENPKCRQVRVEREAISLVGELFLDEEEHEEEDELVEGLVLLGDWLRFGFRQGRHCS